MSGGRDLAEDADRRARHIAAAARAQAAAAARVRAGARARPSTTTDAERAGAYAGLVTRAVAYSLDLALVNVVALLVGAAVALVTSVLHRLPHGLETALGVALACTYGVGLATIPLLAGFLIMLWDDRRRCLQDRMARTVVVHAPPQPRIVRQRIPPEPP